LTYNVCFFIFQDGLASHEDKRCQATEDLITTSTTSLSPSSRMKAFKFKAKPNQPAKLWTICLVVCSLVIGMISLSALKGHMVRTGTTVEELAVLKISVPEKKHIRKFNFLSISKANILDSFLFLNSVCFGLKK